MAYLKLRLLGGFEASLAAATPVEFPTRKAEALLAYLACYPGQRQSRERLASLLWEDFDDEHARANLRQTLKLLRRSVGNSEVPCIITEGRFVHLDPDRVGTDIAEFDRHCRRDTPDDLQHAADVYAGEFLDGYEIGVASFDDWVRDERARYRDRAVEALRKLLEHPVSRGDLDWRIGIALRLLSLDPLQEDMHRKLMRLYADRGDRHLAVRQYRACRDVLRSELGLEPGARTEQLHREIQSGACGAAKSKTAPGPADLTEPTQDRGASRRLGIAPSARICRCPMFHRSPSFPSAI